MKKNVKINILAIIFLTFTLVLSAGAEKEFEFFSNKVKPILTNFQVLNKADEGLDEKKEENKDEKVDENPKEDNKSKDYIYSTMDGKWEKLNDNTWVMDTDGKKENGYEITLTYDGYEWLYEFALEDSDRDYHVFEDIIKDDLRDKFSSIGTDGKPANRYEPGTITKEETKDGVIYTITNKRKDYKTGGFTVTKKVEATDENKKDDKFLFEITLKEGKAEELKIKDSETKKTKIDKKESEETKPEETKPEERKPFKIEGIQIFGDVTFKDGKASVLLGDEESVTIKDLPIGVTFEVKEEKLGYGWSGEVVNGESNKGIISTDLREIVFKNTYNEPQEPPEEKLGGFTLRKEVTGLGETRKYKFLISLTGLKDKEYKYSIVREENKKTEEYTFKGESADIELELGNKEEAVFKELPVGAKYQILEEAGEYESSYKITDTVKVNNILNSNEKENEELSTEKETVDKNENAIVTFTNKLSSTQDLKIKKTVIDTNKPNTNKPNTEIFLINLKLTGLEPRKRYESDFGVILADDDGEFECDINISDGDIFTIKDLPVGAKYKFTELANGYKASYTIEAENGVFVEKSKLNESQGNDLSTEEETIDPGEEATVSFENTKPKEYARIQLIKYSNEGEKKKIGPAKYKLYLDRADQEKEDEFIKEIEIKENGESEILEKINPGKYYVVETQAPPGYSLNPVRKDFEITKEHLGGENVKVVTVEVYDDKVVIPNTGGRGFSILPILGVGVLIVVGYLYKRNKGE